MSYKTLEDIEAAKFLLSPPGDTLQDTITYKGISQAELAKRMKRPVKTINEIIKGKSAILSDTAIQLERVLGISADFWLEREKQYRLELARIAEAEQLLEAKDWLSNFPLSAMKKLGWIDYEKNNLLEQFNAILSFFSVSSINAYHHYYGKQYATNIAFRMGAANKKNTYAVNAWLRKGYLQANETSIIAYDKQKFLDALSEIKKRITENTKNIFIQIQELCASAGVKVVHTPNLPQVKLHGATFWIKDNPVIQLSNYYKRNDIFWFSFFHEAGHIIKHGKKEVFVEGLQYTDKGKAKEKQADKFAVSYIFTRRQEKQFLSKFDIQGDIETQITKFADENNLHPAIIIGRLAKLNILHNSKGWQLNFYQKVDLN